MIDAIKKLRKQAEILANCQIRRIKVTFNSDMMAAVIVVVCVDGPTLTYAQQNDTLVLLDTL